MAVAPFNPNESVPGDSDIASQFPALERTFRDVMESWMLVEHGRSGHHALPSLTTTERNAITDWEVGSLIWNETKNALEFVTSIGPVVWGSGSGFPSGTRLIFPQSAAPTGWTKVTTSALANA